MVYGLDRFCVFSTAYDVETGSNSSQQAVKTQIAYCVLGLYTYACRQRSQLLTGLSVSVTVTELNYNGSIAALFY